MRGSVALAAFALLAIACSSKSKQPEGHASIMECVDGRITNTREVPLSAVADLDIQDYTDCGGGLCVFEGECAAAPADAAASTVPNTVVDLDAPDRMCGSDADCVAMYQAYERDGACCHGCNTAAVSRLWAARAQTRCSAMGDEGCPLKKCAALRVATCQQGVCTAGAVPAND